jgi:hypothetical protein
MTFLSTNDTMTHLSATLCPAYKLHISNDNFRAYVVPQGPYYHRLIIKYSPSLKSANMSNRTRERSVQDTQLLTEEVEPSVTDTNSVGQTLVDQRCSESVCWQSLSLSAFVQLLFGFSLLPSIRTGWANSI